MQLNRFAPLYKLAKSGKLTYWEIWTRGNEIHSKSGFDEGKMQEHFDIVANGKNIGKANATTPAEQAYKEAQSKWQKKVNAGYHHDYYAAQRGENVNLKSYTPMKAHTYNDQWKKIVYPCFVQPKLDGLRAARDKWFYSYYRKPFPLIKHIEDDMNMHGIECARFDGELYCHEYKKDFEKIVSMIKRGKTDHPDILKLQYHVFDIRAPGPYGLRFSQLKRYKDTMYVKFVPSYIVYSHDEMMTVYEDFLEQGYEGLMLRNYHGLYEEDARSYDLQKHKEFVESEFPIIGIEEGRGKLMGHVGKFVCSHKGNDFRVTLNCKRPFLKQCFIDHTIWEDMWMTVRHQGYTRKNNLPRIAKGLRIRGLE